jgi:uncharacterized protein (TIGR02246 family)
MDDDELQIRKLIAEWLDATARGDINAVLALMSDDVEFLTAGRSPFGKKEFAAQSAGMEGLQFKGRSDIREIEVAGRWAWVRSVIAVEMMPKGGETLKYNGPVLSVFRKEADGKWRLYRDANFVDSASA